MLRQIAVMFLALMVTPSLMAAYPEDYFGPPLPDGCMEIEAYVPEGGFLDRNPWSMPSPEEGIFWFGTLCVEGGVAALEFTQIANRACYKHPWGIPGDPDVCYAGWTIEIREPDRHVMAWDLDFKVDWGFYIASIFMGEWEWQYESLTARADGTAVFVTGVFEYVQPLWFVESDKWTRWKFLVSPRVAKGFPMRRSFGRY